MREDLSGFGVFILTNRRPDRQTTLATLMERMHTSPVWLVVDDEDPTLPEYRERYGDRVLVFSKSESAAATDYGDNFPGRGTVLFARNAAWGLARSLGLKYLCVLDDDYSGIYCKFRRDWTYCSIAIADFDKLHAAALRMLRASGASAFCWAQGGDFIGGFPATKTLLVGRRKVMNWWYLDVSRPFQYVSRLNDDVSTYVEAGRRGVLFLTSMLVSVIQVQTQLNAGGLTETYLEMGTYAKSFYSVMYCPSAVKVGKMGDHRSPHFRLHHSIDWRYSAAKIVRESVRKPRADAGA